MKVKKIKIKKENVSNSTFEAELFKAADKLRANMEPSDYKHVVLGLIFLKYISDKFDAKYQQLLKESNSYNTDINVNISDPEKASEMAKKIALLTGYNAEGWKEANETMMAANKMRKIVITFVSLTILLVAGFGIYNILNMTVSQKINDIAILKAIGFKGKDVIRIFVTQAVTIGILGVIGGMLMATILITFLKTVYIGGDIGYFPIDYEPTKFIQGVLIGLFITFWAGYIPARKAAKVDPVDILRK